MRFYHPGLYWARPKHPHVFFKVAWRLIVVVSFLQISTIASRAQLPSPPADAQGEALPTLAPLVKKVSAGIVNISVRERAPVQEPLVIDPESRQFPDAPYSSTDRETKAAGVVVDAREGLIVTNNHVIEHAHDISVDLADGRRIHGSAIASDPMTDIAVIRITASDLVAVPVGDSDKVEVGDYLVALGNPFGMGTTVTHGIVSALHRSYPRLKGYQDFIQTDAAISPGASGGPVVNLRGELVGIITASIGDNVGMGLAIPSNRVREAIARVGEVEHERLRMSFQ
jgi:S1-C subfamily serine protease